MEQRFLDVELQFAQRCPCCNVVHDDTHRSRVCTRLSVHVTQFKPLIHTMSRIVKGLFIAHTLEDGTSFLAGRDLQKNICGGDPRRLDPGVLPQGVFIETTLTDPQTMIHLHNESADADESAAFSTEARKSAPYARRGQLSFDEHSYKLTTLVESFGCLGTNGVEFVEQVGTKEYNSRRNG